MGNTTKIITALELYQQKIRKLHIAKHLNKHRETIGIWVDGIEELGLKKFLDNYENAKKVERKAKHIDPKLKMKVCEIREREFDCCG